MSFKRNSVLGLLLAAVMLTVACSTNWVTTAAEILAAVTPAVTNLLPVIELADKSVTPADAAKIQAYSQQGQSALELTASLIGQYNTAEAGQQATVLVRLQNALTVAQNNLNQILSTVHVYDPNATSGATQAVQIALSEVSSLQSLLPILKSGSTARTIKLAKPLSADRFRSRFNKAVDKVPGANNFRLPRTHSALNSLGNAIGESLWGNTD